MTSTSTEQHRGGHQREGYKQKWRVSVQAELSLRLPHSVLLLRETELCWREKSAEHMHTGDSPNHTVCSAYAEQ
jgi:hypothetical protein